LTLPLNENFEITLPLTGQAQAKRLAVNAGFGFETGFAVYTVLGAADFLAAGLSDDAFDFDDNRAGTPANFNRCPA
jgi:hypothetical protein